MRLMTPEQVRVRSHADAASCPALAELRATLKSGAEAERQFWEWLASPFSQKMVRALEEMADNPPVLSADTRDSLLVQYGVTTGLQLAVKMLSNPKRVFPDVFRDPVATSGDGSFGSYTENADQVIDRM